MTEPQPTALVVRHLTSANGRAVVRDISLDVEAGQCVGVSGSTEANTGLLLRVLATLVRPAAGSVHVHGVDALADPFAVRPRLAFAGGYASEDAAPDVVECGGLDPRLTVLDHLRFMFLARRPAAANDSDGYQIVNAVASRIGLAPHRSVGSLTTRERALVVLGSCLLARPAVVLVEEPPGGFGATAERALALVAEARSNGAAVLLAAAEGTIARHACSRWLWLDEEGRCRTSA